VAVSLALASFRGTVDGSRRPGSCSTVPPGPTWHGSWHVPGVIPGAVARPEGGCIGRQVHVVGQPSIGHPLAQRSPHAPRADLVERVRFEAMWGGVGAWRRSVDGHVDLRAADLGAASAGEIEIETSKPWRLRACARHLAGCWLAGSGRPARRVVCGGWWIGGWLRSISLIRAPAARLATTCSTTTGTLGGHAAARDAFLEKAARYVLFDDLAIPCVHLQSAFGSEVTA
jgi:hypothetical protein